MPYVIVADNSALWWGQALDSSDGVPTRRVGTPGYGTALFPLVPE